MDKDKIQIGGNYPPRGEPYTALLARDRQAIIEVFDKCREHQHQLGIRQDHAFEITMPCGYSKKFKEHSNIPTEDLPCPCGRAERYLIKYKKE